MITLRSKAVHASLACTLIVMTGWCVTAGEPKIAAKPLTIVECKQLVEQLANPNKPPFTELYVRELPKGVRETDLNDSQKPIAAAYNLLSANIEVALPVLLANCDDKRFSYVYEVGISAVYKCETVGGACSRIIGAHIDVCSNVVTKYNAEGRSKSLQFNYDKAGGYEKWWKDRDGWNVRELQLGLIELALRQPQPDFFSAREWATAKKELNRLAKQIRDTKRPIPVEHKVQFFSK